MEYKFECLRVAFAQTGVLHVELHRPNKGNAINKKMWAELRTCFETVNKDPDVRAVVISGSGKHFCTGIDVMDLSSDFGTFGDLDVGRRALRLKSMVSDMQQSFTAIELCRQPVIAAVHGACVGAGVDMITACDIRFCSDDAWFSVKEVDMGLAADVGTLQRLPKVIGNDSVVRELVYTGRRFDAAESQRIGLVSRVTSGSRAGIVEEAVRTAAQIAAKSPLVVAGCKKVLLYTRDHSVSDGLDYITTWNMAMLQSQDFLEAVTASLEKRVPVFAKL